MVFVISNFKGACTFLIRFYFPPQAAGAVAPKKLSSAPQSGVRVTPKAARNLGQRVKGIEPSSVAWKATALPLSYTRVRTAQIAVPACSCQVVFPRPRDRSEERRVGKE